MQRLHFYALAILGLLSVFVPPGVTQTVTATIPVGTSPNAVAVNPVTNKIYVISFTSSNNVTVIDGATNAVTSTITVGLGPWEVAVNPVTNKIYVANQGSNDVQVIDGANDTVVATVTGGTSPGAVAVNPVTNKVYVANSSSANVTVIDGATNSITATVGVGFSPFAVAVNPVTNRVYVTNYISGNITVIDGSNNTVVATVNAGTSPSAVTVNPVTNEIFVANQGSNNVTVINGANNAVLATINVGTTPQTVTLDPVTDKIYVANNASNNVTVIDGATNSASATVTAGTRPWGVAVNPATNQIYVSNDVSGDVTVIDGGSNSVSSTLVAGTNPRAITVNPVTNKVYAANNSSNNVTVIDGATNATATIATGTTPYAVATNPLTNKVYIANGGSNNVTVIDGGTNAVLATIAAGTVPSAIAVNPVTNKIYIANTGPAANTGSSDVTVIDGVSDNVVTSINVGANPTAIAVDPVANKIYVASGLLANLTVIDGASDTVVATVATGGFPVRGPDAVAVNPVTNKIYVAGNPGSAIVSGSVTVIDGTSDAVAATVATGPGSLAVGVNTVTNKIYVANEGFSPSYIGSVSVIDGSNNGVTTFPVASAPTSVGVNPFTDKIYVTNSNGTVNTVTVIDGATNNTTTITAGGNPFQITVNLATNKIYVANLNGSNMTVIDGATNTTTAVGTGLGSYAVALNPVTNRVYAANYVSNNVTVLTEQQVQPVPLVTTITALPGNQTTSPTPTFTFTVTSSYTPTAPTPQSVYYQVDTWQGQWTLASGTNPTFSGQTAPLSLGPHVLYAYAGDGQEAGIVGGGINGQVTSGAIAAYPFTVMQVATTTSLSSSPNPSDLGQTLILTATVAVVAPGMGTPTGSVTFLDGTSSLGSVTLPSNLQASLNVSALTAGAHSLTAQYSGDGIFLGGTSPTLTETVNVVPMVATTSLPPGLIGAAYSQALQASGGTAPYTWSLASGSLPAGLSLSTAGVISGTPTTAGTSSFTVSVKDANALTATQALGIVVPSSPTVTSASLPLGVIATAYNQTLQATGGTTPYTWTVASGNLPAGLSLSTAGVISGTPTTAGTSNFTVSVKDANALTATRTLSIVIVSQLAVTTASLPGGAVGTLYSQTLQAAGGTAPYTWSLASGTLPAGLSLSAAGVISGTPTAAGTSNFTVSVKDANALTATKTLSIVIVSQLAVTTASLPGGTVGTAYSQTLQAAGGTAPYTWSLASGSLPAGLSLSAAGLISGTPTTAGTSSFTVGVKDANALTATQALNIAVTSQPAVTTASLPAGAIGTNYSQTLQAAGGTAPYTWSLASGTLPAGLSLSAAGAISGTPTTAGTSSFTVSAKDANALTATKALSILVVSQLTVTTASLPAVVIGTAHSQALQAAGGTAPYTWSVASGSLPAGLSLSAAGLISGTPTTAGTSSFTASVKDAAALTASKALSIVVVLPLTVTTASLPGGAIGTAYSQTLQASGGTAPYTWSVASGALPAGLSLSATGAISGTPTTAGNSSFTVSVKDANSFTATSTLIIVVVSQLTVTTASLPGVVIGTAYSQTLQAAGGTSPYTWSIASGSLPAGLSLSAAGAISGTPTTAGTSSFTVSVKDTNALAATKALNVVVVPPLTVTTTSLPGGAVGTAYNQTLQATGGTSPYTWSLASGTLPAGLSLSAAGAISGTPTTAGTSSFTVSIKDANVLTATQALSIVVVPPLTVTTTSLPGGTIGTASSQAVQAAGGTPPYTWSVGSGSLPPGLSLSAAGAISGTPTTAGTFNLTVIVADASGAMSTSGLLSVVVVAPPNAPTCTPPTVQSNSTNPLIVNATSNCTDAQSAITSTTIDWGDGSSPLSGTTGSHPYSAAGTYSITVSATNASNLTNSASGSVTVTASLTTAVTQGQAAQQTVNVTAPLGVPSVQVTYQCSGANGPSGPQTLAFYHLSCNINGQGTTAMVTLTSTPTPITVTVQTNSSSTAGLTQPGLRKGSAGALYAAVLMAPGIVLLGIGRFSKRRRRLSQFIGLALLGMLMWSLLACGGGGGGSSPTPPPQQQTTTPPGGYTVTGTGTSSSGSSSTIIVGFTVNIGG